MYPNLSAELTRRNLTQNDLAKLLNIDLSTVNYKMNGKSDWKLNECKKIISNMFPEQSIDYLFNVNNNLLKEK